MRLCISDVHLHIFLSFSSLLLPLMCRSQFSSKFWEMKESFWSSMTDVICHYIIIPPNKSPSQKDMCVVFPQRTSRWPPINMVGAACKENVNYRKKENTFKLMWVSCRDSLKLHWMKKIWPFESWSNFFLLSNRNSRKLWKIICCVYTERKIQTTCFYVLFHQKI